MTALAVEVEAPLERVLRELVGPRVGGLPMPQQIRAMRERIEAMADYLKRLQRRMAKQCFNDADPFTWKVREAPAAIEALASTLAGLDIDGPLPPHGKPTRTGELH